MCDLSRILDGECEDMPTLTPEQSAILEHALAVIGVEAIRFIAAANGYDPDRLIGALTAVYSVFSQTPTTIDDSALTRQDSVPVLEQWFQNLID